MRKLLVGLSILFIAGSATGTTIASEEVSVDLEDSTVSVHLDVKELTSSRLTYYAPVRMSDVRTSIDGEKASCRVFRSESGSQISCPTQVKQNFTLEIEYSSEDLKKGRNGKKVFRFQKNFTRPTENYRLDVLLPRGGLLVRNETDSSVIPKNGSIRTDGQRIGVTWERNPELGSGVTFSAEYRVIRDDRIDGEIVIGIILATLGLAAGLYFFYRIHRSEELSSVFPELDEDEIEVVETIADNEGSILQKDLVDRSEYSKAKISGVVSSLVDKDILDKKKSGRSNRLSLKKKFTY
ncbi:MAG: helix-turn-helix transcriptional regulator [Candidatus Nanohaloarchaea archaeon]